jgi:hypothetical protein
MNNKTTATLTTARNLIPGLIWLAFLVILLLPGRTVRAQAIDDTWSPQVNLSQSGGATNPVMVVDEAGIIHVFWLDQYAGYYYRSGDGETWTDAVQVDPPFDPFAPTLVLGTNNRVHAFWIDDGGDLLLSRANVDQLSLSSAWESPRLMAESVVKFVADVDPQGAIELAFLHNDDVDGMPAGVYYQSSSDNGASWSAAQPLIQSPYLRSLVAANASIDMASAVLGEGTWVYVGWDNRIRKNISLVRSLNGGRSWDEPMMIDGPEYGSASVIPYNLRVAASGEKALLVWQRGQPGARCTLHYMWSGDRGNSWSTRLRMLEEIQGCPTETSFVPVGHDFFLFQAAFPEFVYLIAWDGTRWSEPQIQRSIAEFEDPETFNLLDFSCREYGTNPLTNRLVLVGCDTIGAGDIWLTGRDIGGVSAWYPPEPIWRQPVSIASPPEEILDPVLIAGPDDLLHAMWSQVGGVPTAAGETTRINYARWFEQSWSRPAEVLASVEGNAWNPDLTLDPLGRMFAVWSDGDAGQIKFAWAGASQAYRLSDWTVARELPSPVAIGSNPDIESFGQDMHYVVYAVPLNEARGVYLTVSEDAGNTWSDSIMVFDAAEAGWDMIDRPEVSVTSDGTLHILFTRFTLPSGRGPLGLYYTRSQDGGLTWSPAETVAEGHLFWSQIQTAGDDVLHRIWQVEDTASSRRIIQHQYSLDRGLSWSGLEIISTLHLAGPVDIDIDSLGRLHLLMTVTYITGEMGLEHWVWSGDQWVLNSSLNLQETEVSDIVSISISVTPDGRLGALYSGNTLSTRIDLTEESSGISQVSHFVAYTSRDLDVSLPAVAPLPVVDILPNQTPEPTSPPPVESSPEAELPEPPQEELPGSSPAQNGNTWMGLVLGAGLAVVLVVVAFGVNARRMSQR